MTNEEDRGLWHSGLSKTGKAHDKGFKCAHTLLLFYSEMGMLTLFTFTVLHTCTSKSMYINFAYMLFVPTMNKFY
jgi:hypothetical protein